MFVWPHQQCGRAGSPGVRFSKSSFESISGTNGMDYSRSVRAHTACLCFFLCQEVLVFGLRRSEVLWIICTTTPNLTHIDYIWWCVCPVCIGKWHCHNFYLYGHDGVKFRHWCVDIILRTNARVIYSNVKPRVRTSISRTTILKLKIWDWNEYLLLDAECTRLYFVQFCVFTIFTNQFLVWSRFTDRAILHTSM